MIMRTLNTLHHLATRESVYVLDSIIHLLPFFTGCAFDATFVVYPLVFQSKP